jgi:hypothetical protein
MAELDASIRQKIGDLVSDAEVDRWQLCSLSPPVPEEIVFLEEDIHYEPFEGDAGVLLCWKTTTTLWKLTRRSP